MFNPCVALTVIDVHPCTLAVVVTHSYTLIYSSVLLNKLVFTCIFMYVCIYGLLLFLIATPLLEEIIISWVGKSQEMHRMIHSFYSWHGNFLQ